MSAAVEKPFVATGALDVGLDLSLLEQPRQALAMIESKLSAKLKTMAFLSTPAGIDDVQWQSAKVAMEVQAKKDAEKGKFPYKGVKKLSELYQIYESLMNDAKSLLATPKHRASEFEEAEEKIEALMYESSHKNASLKLDLHGLLLHGVPDAIQKLSSTLVKLDLSNNDLDSFPESVTSLVNLVHLDIQSNQLTSLPNSVGNLAKLKILNVSGNNLTALPDGIAKCRELEELIANFNQLRRLPETLGFELLNLRKLCVHSNEITRLPYSISHMMSLRFLDVHTNKLRDLPEDLENLMNLEYLDLSCNFNYLVALPESIGGLTSLIELNISYNQITALPDSIGRLEKLQRLKVEGNPLVVPPPQVVDQNVDAIREYMADRLKAQKNKCGMKSARESWLRRTVPKLVTCVTAGSDFSKAMAWQECPSEDSDSEVKEAQFCISSTARRRHASFATRHSSSPPSAL